MVNNKASPHRQNKDNKTFCDLEVPGGLCQVLYTMQGSSFMQMFKKKLLKSNSVVSLAQDYI